MLNDKLIILKFLIISFIIILIPNIYILFSIMFILLIFDLLFIYKYYIPFIILITMISLSFSNIYITSLIFIKTILILILLSNYIKKVSIKKFKSSIHNFTKLFKIDSNKLSNKITLFIYTPLFINNKSNIIKKSLALQGLDIYHSNLRGKIIVYKYIFTNIRRLVKEEKQSYCYFINK